MGYKIIVNNIVRAINSLCAHNHDSQFLTHKCPWLFQYFSVCYFTNTNIYLTHTVQLKIREKIKIKIGSNSLTFQSVKNSLAFPLTRRCPPYFSRFSDGCMNHENKGYLFKNKWFVRVLFLPEFPGRLLDHPPQLEPLHPAYLSHY